MYKRLWYSNAYNNMFVATIWWIKRNVVEHINEVTLRQARMGDHLWAGKPSQHVTATQVDSAFYPPWDGKTSISFRAE